MNRRWIQLLERDTGARGHILLSSMLATAAAGFLADINGIPLQAAEIWALIVGGLVFLVQGSFYASDAQLKPIPKLKTVPRRIFYPLLTIAGSGVAALFISIFAPIVQGSVFNRRLSHVLTIAKSPVKEAKAAKIINLATRSNVKLNPDLLAAVVGQAQENRSADDWQAMLAAVNYKFSPRLTDPSEMSRLPTLTFPPNAVVSGVHFAKYRFVYHGDPLSLLGVVFEDTVFEIDHSPNGERLAEALLASKNGAVSVTLP